MFCEKYTQQVSIPVESEPRSSDNSTFNKIAINCTSSGMLVDTDRTSMISGAQGVSDGVRDLISNSLSPATRRAYAADLAHFRAWGGVIPSTPEVVAEYLAELAETHTVATINRRLASLAKAHRALGAEDPTKAEMKRAGISGGCLV